MIFQGLAVAGIAGMLAGCASSGSSQVPSAASAGAYSPMSQWVGDDKCTKSGGVSVTPCKVDLTVSNPTVTLTVKSPNGSTVSVKDKHCTKAAIAEVEGSGSTWDATAGTKAGNCTAMFIAKDTKGHKLGSAVLSITNKV